jgi:hypothetical protein
MVFRQNRVPTCTIPKNHVVRVTDPSYCGEWVNWRNTGGKGFALDSAESEGPVLGDS